MENTSSINRTYTHTRSQTCSNNNLSSVQQGVERSMQKVSHSKKPYEQYSRASEACKYDKENAPNFKRNTKKTDKVQQLVQIDRLKASNIDELNIKIRNMVNKLTIDEKPTNSFVREGPIKERLKTDYTTSYSHIQSYDLREERVDKNQKQSRLDSNTLAISKIIDPIFSSVDREKLKEKSAKKYELQRIRSKYKQSQKQLTCSSTFDSKLETFGSKLKSSNKTQWQSHCNESNLTASFASDKEANNFQVISIGKKRNINEDLAAYQKKVEGYKDHKEALLNQCRRKPLQDTTNTYNGTNHRNNCLQSTTQPIMSLLSNAYKSDEQSDPPTADFRMNQESNQLKILLSNMIDQIKLDQRFRNAKKWFSRVSFSDKWKELDRCLQLNGVSLDSDSIRQIFTLQEEEENPFYSYKEKDFDIRAVAQQFVKCEENWFLNMVKKFDRESLEVAGFRNSKIDATQKGYLSIEDLVRFLNVEMDVHYRTRDMYLIYLRLKSEHRLAYEQIIEVICY